MLIDRLRSWIDDPTPPQGLAMPTVEPPPLHDLRVSVPAPGPDRELTEEGLLALFAERVRELAPRRRRETGEFAAPGDEVRLQMCFFADGSARARTAAAGRWLIAGEPWELPGVGEALVGVTADELLAIPVRFPDDWPAVALRGVAGIYRARVLEIDEVTLPGDPEDPGFLQALGVDVDLPTFMVQLREEYVAGLTRALQDQAITLTLALLRGRSPVEVPKELVERETFERWARAEGAPMLALGADEADLNLSFASWLRDDFLRTEITDRVHNALLIGAIGRRDGVQITDATLEARLEEVAGPLGFTVDEAKAAMREDPASGERFVQEAYHLQCVDWIMANATVRYAQPR